MFNLWVEGWSNLNSENLASFGVHCLVDLGVSSVANLLTELVILIEGPSILN